MAINALLKAKAQNEAYCFGPGNRERRKEKRAIEKRKRSGGIPSEKMPIIRVIAIGRPVAEKYPYFSYATLTTTSYRSDLDMVGGHTSLQSALGTWKAGSFSHTKNPVTFDAFIKVELGSSAHDAIARQRQWAAQLAETLAAKMRPAFSSPSNDEFNPSNRLAQFLVDGSGDDPLTLEEAKKLLKRFVRSVIETIADSLDEHDANSVQLTENGQFRENVARVLLHRFPVGVYRQGDFLTTLLSEITPAAQGGQLETASGVLVSHDGELVVKRTGRNPPPLLPNDPWVRATTARS